MFANSRLWFCCCVFVLVACRQGVASVAAVTIQMVDGKGSNAFGSGFVSSPDGEVVTCYHVVQNARHITIFYNHNAYSSRVQRIWPDRDLVLLKMEDVPLPTTFLPIAYELPAGIQREQLTVEGFQAGMFDQRILASATADGLKLSGDLKGNGNKRIFRKLDVKILPLNLIIYKGLSGAPVLTKSGRVIGVVSGSLNEGGAMAWEIAMDNFRPEYSTLVTEPITSFVWPESSLMAGGWENLRREDGIGEPLIKAIEAVTIAAQGRERSLSIACKNADDVISHIYQIIDLLSGRPDLSNLSRDALSTGLLEDSFGSSLNQLERELALSEEQGEIPWSNVKLAEHEMMIKLRLAINAGSDYQINLPKTAHNDAVAKELQESLTRLISQRFIMDMSKSELKSPAFTAHDSIGNLKVSYLLLSYTVKELKLRRCVEPKQYPDMMLSAAGMFRILLTADILDPAQ